MLLFEKKQVKFWEGKMFISLTCNALIEAQILGLSLPFH